MVAVLWQLKWRLLRNGWRGGIARVAAAALALVVGLGLAGVGLATTVGLRLADPATAATVVVLAGSALVLGWVLLPILAFGVDETLDPARFALLPLPRRTLTLGLLAASFLGVPAAGTALVALGTVVTWSRGPLPVLYALLGAVAGTLLCLVASRAATTALSGVLQGRRARDLTSVLAVLGISSIGLVQIAVTRLAESTPAEAVERVVSVLSWTPLGAAWAAPYDAVLGRPGTGAARLALVGASVLVLGLLWERALGRRLEGVGSGRATSSVKAGRSLTPAPVARLLAGGPTGAVASRSLRYWWRDPRQRVTVLVLPVVVLVVGIGPALTGVPAALALAAGPALAALLGLSMLNETAWDGSALWTHLAAGVPGQADRAGRAVAVLVWAGPPLVAVSAGSAVLAGRTALVPAAVGAALTVLLAGLAVAAVVGVLAPYAVPEAGSNPFATSNAGSVLSVLQQMAGAGVAAVLSLPALALLVGAALWTPVLGWVLLLAGPAYGAVLLRIGTRIGGDQLESRGPEILATVSKRL